ncbi:MAG: 5-(carboxyamino)imidazole ribonucleotide synthase [Proteobacteria bacterium]|nr:5-(carboxyamino)imidazole ribonucleotide synthase [Pseudomonadota bacterium]
MRLGILGGGQLARMMALEAHWLGIETHVYDPKHDCCAGLVATHHRAEFDDRQSLLKFARNCSVVTCDFENVPSSSIAWLEEAGTVFHPRGIQYFQNRYVEKGFLKQHGLPVVEFLPAYSLEGLKRAVATMQPPLVIKKQLMGYDGKGQVVLRKVGDVERAWRKLKLSEDDPVLVERLVAFDRELSIVAVRSRDGRFIHYPLCENCHHHGILKCTFVTTQSTALTLKAAGYAHKLMKNLDYLGVMVVEFFEHNNDLVINEVAPRPHNSGHWSVEGAVCSQFENHVRSVLEMPLGAAIAHFPCCAMLNLIGADVAENARHDKRILQLNFILPNYATVHNYCKAHQPGRKLGHIFIYATRTSLLIKRVEEVRDLITGTTDLYDMEFDIPQKLGIEH